MFMDALYIMNIVIYGINFCTQFNTSNPFYFIINHSEEIITVIYRIISINGMMNNDFSKNWTHIKLKLLKYVSGY